MPLVKTRKSLAFQHVVLLGAALAGASACEDDGAVEVQVCGDMRVPEDAHTLRVALLDEGRNPRQEGIIELLECPGERLHTLPQSIDVTRLDGASWLQAQALREGIVVATFERRARLDEAEGRLLLGLTRDCLGVQCALGQTCIDGLCVIAPFQVDRTICAGATAGPGDEADAGGMDADDTGGAEPDAGAPGDDAGAEPDVPPLCPPDPFADPQDEEEP